MNDDKSCNVRWKLHGNISRNSYGNAVIGRYGGCFEEDLWAYVQENKRKFSHVFWMYWRSMHNSQCEQKAIHNTEEASKYGWCKCQKPQLNISQKNSQAYSKQLVGSTLRAWLNFTPRRVVHGGTSTPLDPSTFSTTQLLRFTFRHGKLSSSIAPSTILESLQCGTSLKTTIH